MSAEETLTDYVNTYLLLFAKHGRDSKCVQEHYRKLKTLLIMDIYFMNNVKMIVTEDEMSGFVLFVEKHLPSIVEAYKPYHGSFSNYLRRVMELRAFSYIGGVMKRRHVADLHRMEYMPYTECIAERGTDEDFYSRQENEDYEAVRARTLNRLRYFCARRPKGRRCLFVFLCTQMTYLSVDAIDRFCEVLNCDKDQTFAIADYLHDQETKTNKAQVRAGIERQRDRHWCRILEYQSRIMTSLKPEKYVDKLRMHRMRFMVRSSELRNLRKNVPYNLVAEILNIDRMKVSSEVYHAKEILELATADVINPWDGPMGILASVPEERMVNHCISRFEPFKVFNVHLIHLRNAQKNSVSICLKEARESS